MEWVFYRLEGRQRGSYMRRVTDRPCWDAVTPFARVAYGRLGCVGGMDDRPCVALRPTLIGQRQYTAPESLPKNTATNSGYRIVSFILRAAKRAIANQYYDGIPDQGLTP